MDDKELLSLFVREKSEKTFRILVERHYSMVYGICLRGLEDKHLAEDAAQVVFMLLAEKASSIRRPGALSAYLFKTAHSVVINMSKKRYRRLKREKEVSSMKKPYTEAEETGGCLEEVRAYLNEAVASLGRKKREAVIGHYLEGKDHRELARELGCSEGAVKMRVSRGLRQLRAFFAARNIMLPSGIFAGILTEEAGYSVPPAAVESCVNASMAALAGNTAGIGPLVSIAEGVNRMMIMAKVMKIAVLMCTVLAFISGGILFKVQLQADEAVRDDEGNTESSLLSLKVPETALSRLAASLQPGQMKEFKTKGYNGNLLRAWYKWDFDSKGTRLHGSKKMYNIVDSWANDGKWDPKTRQVLYMGIGHYTSLKFITYSADTNAWTLMPVPSWCDPRSPKSVACKNQKGRRVWPRSHTYDNQFISPEKRLFGILWRPRIYSYDIDKKKWQYRSAPSARSKNCDMPAEYFPEMKGVLYVGSGRRLVLCDPLTGKERALGRAPISMHGVMEYNPVYKVMLIAGGDGNKGKGNRRAVLVDGKGKISKIKPLPVHVNCRPGAKLMCDPVSGEYVVHSFYNRRSKGTRKAYALHPKLNEWKEMPGTSFPEGVAVPVSTYGVFMICTPRKVYVYKHKPLWPDQVPGSSK